MGNILCRLEDDRHDLLKSISQTTGVPMSHLIRQAIDSFLFSGSINYQVSANLISGHVVIIGAR